MSSYKILNNQCFSSGEYAIVPIRREDCYDIMKWRNEQMYHLRQNGLLTKEKQNFYFDNVISNLFIKDQPEQLLFSYLKGDECIGYGGLVHINWIDKNAEISFIMATELEEDGFDIHWSKFLELIENVAFQDLELHKIYVYAFDLRPHLYDTLKKNNYFEDAVLKQHCLFRKKYIDVIIHSKLNSK